MVKIIFVCLGNICRSPMAEMMMTDLVKRNNLESQIKVESRATSTYEIGNSPHSGAIKELKKQNIPLINHRAEQISEQDFKNADLIIGMDKQNILDLKEMTSKNNWSKIHLAFTSMNKSAEVQDPWYDHNFERTYKQLRELLPKWLEIIQNEYLKGE